MILLVLLFNYYFVVTSYTYVLPRFVALVPPRSTNSRTSSRFTSTDRSYNLIPCPSSNLRQFHIGLDSSSNVILRSHWNKSDNDPIGEELGGGEIDEDNKGSPSRISSDADNSHRTVVSPPIEVLDVTWEQKVRDMTLSQLWEALDRRRLQYLTTDSRKNLETLLLQSYSMPFPAATSSNSRPTYQGTGRSRRGNIRRRNIPSLQPSLWDQLSLADYYSSSPSSVIYNPSRSRKKNRTRNDFRYISKNYEDDTYYYSRTPKITMQPTSRPSNVLLDKVTTSANQTIYDNDYKPSTTTEMPQLTRSNNIPTSTNRRIQPRRVSILPPAPRTRMRKSSDYNYNTWADKFIQNVDLLLGIDDPYYRKQQRATGSSNIKRNTKATYDEGENGEEETEKDTKNMLSMVLFGKPQKPNTKNKKALLWRNRIPSSLFFFPTNSQNVCTSTLSAALQLSLVGLANLCRWATVQGTLPQPLVVFTLLSSVLAARRKRFLVGAATIIALRTIGEIVSSSSTQESNDGITDANVNDYSLPVERKRRRRRRSNELLLPSALEASTSYTPDRTSTKQRKLQRMDDERDEENYESDEESHLQRSRMGRPQRRQRRNKNTSE
jgi:hypothetical protein